MLDSFSFRTSGYMLALLDLFLILHFNKFIGKKHLVCAELLHGLQRFYFKGRV